MASTNRASGQGHPNVERPLEIGHIGKFKNGLSECSPLVVRPGRLEANVSLPSGNQRTPRHGRLLFPVPQVVPGDGQKFQFPVRLRPIWLTGRAWRGGRRRRSSLLAVRCAIHAIHSREVLQGLARAKFNRIGFYRSSRTSFDTGGGLTCIAGRHINFAIALPAHE